MFKKRDNTGVVKITVANVIANFDTSVAVRDRALKLLAGQIGVLQGYLTEWNEPALTGIGHLERTVVENFRDVCCDNTGFFIAEKNWGG